MLGKTLEMLEEGPGETDSSGVIGQELLVEYV